jgi:hypothetical protein
VPGANNEYKTGALAVKGFPNWQIYRKPDSQFERELAQNASISSISQACLLSDIERLAAV